MRCFIPSRLGLEHLELWLFGLFNRIFDLNSKFLWSDVLRTQINGMGVILQNIKVNEEMPTFICRMHRLI